MQIASLHLIPGPLNLWLHHRGWNGSLWRFQWTHRKPFLNAGSGIQKSVPSMVTKHVLPLSFMHRLSHFIYDTQRQRELCCASISNWPQVLLTSFLHWRAIAGRTLQRHLLKVFLATRQKDCSTGSVQHVFIHRSVHIRCFGLTFSWNSSRHKFQMWCVLRGAMPNSALKSRRSLVLPSMAFPIFTNFDVPVMVELMNTMTNKPQQTATKWSLKQWTFDNWLTCCTEHCVACLLSSLLSTVLVW